MKTVLYCLLGLICTAHTAMADQIIMTTSDYESGNTAVFNTESGALDPAALGQGDQDAVVDTDGENIYFLSRTFGSIAKYDPAGLTDGTAGDSMIWEYSVGPDSNPYDMVFLESKAYVIRFGSSEILIVDHTADDAAAFELGTIDLSAFDEDGEPDALYGFEHDGMVYVVLQRLTNWEAHVPGYLVKIDPATDTVVDLDPDTAGTQGMELLVTNPQYFSQSGATAYIGGHVWGAQTEGVQTVGLDSPDLTQTMVLDEGSLMMDITGVHVFDDARGIFYSTSWVQDGDTWIQVGAAYWFDPTTGGMGASLPVPTPDGGAVMVDGILYIASRDNTASGLYPVDPLTNTIAGDVLAPTLPPLSMVRISNALPTDVAEQVNRPASVALDAPHPNPFNPSTTITFALSTAGLTRIDVFNAAGQRVDTLVDAYMAAGTHSLAWEAGSVSNGAYFVTVRHGNSVSTAKVMLVK